MCGLAVLIGGPMSDDEIKSPDSDGKDEMNEKVIPLRRDEIAKQVSNRVAEEENKHGDSGSGGGDGVDSGFIKDCLDAEVLGHAEMYKAINKGFFLYNKTMKTWLIWAGHHWDVDVMDSAVAAVERIAERYQEEITGINKELRGLEDKDPKEKALKNTRKALNKAIKWLRKPGPREQVLLMTHTSDNPMAISGSEIDKRPWLLACKNGVIDLKTGDLRPGRPDDYLMRSCPTEWHGIDADCEIWETALLEIFDGDESMVEYLQRLFGMAIVGAVYEHVFPIFIGPGGRNGKSTIVEAISNVLGPLAGPIQAEMLLSTYRVNPAAPSPEIMDLNGLRIVWASEPEDGSKISLGKCKWLTGGDALKGRYHHSNPMEFQPTHTMFLLSNFRLRADSNDDAFWERVHNILFNIRFLKNGKPSADNEREADIYLKEKLREINSGILAWLVKGCLLWQELGLQPPPKVMKETKDWQQEEDNYSLFASFLCETGSDYKVNATDLYDAYYKWHKKYVSKWVPAQKKFGSNMRRKFEYNQKSGYWFYFGVRLKEDWEQILGDVPGESKKKHDHFSDGHDPINTGN